MNRAPFRERIWQRAPPTAASEQVQHSTEHVIQIHLAPGGLLAGALQKRADVFELLATDVTGDRLVPSR